MLSKSLNRESFLKFFKNIPIPTVAWQKIEEDLVLIDYNNEAEEITNNKIKDFVGLSASELFKENEIDEKIFTDLKKCAHEESNFSDELEYQLKTTGENKAFLVKYSFIPPDLVIVYADDITAQKQVKSALHEARDILTGLELIINQSPAVVFLLRNEEGWPVEYITDNIKQFGYEPSDFYSHLLHFADIIHPDDLEKVVYEIYNNCENSTYEFVQEYRIVSKTGDPRWINVRTWLKRDRENSVTHFQGIILDITERKETEEKLKESEEKFRKITEKSLLGVVIFQDGLIKYVNKALADLAEYSIEEIREWQINEFAKTIHPEDLPNVTQHIQEKLKDQKDVTSRYIFRIITKSGKVKWLEIISKAITYQGKLAILGAMIDVTEKKEVEIKLRCSEENLKKLNEELERKVSERTQELRESETKYRLITENANDLIALYNDKFELEYINEGVLKRILGYSFEDIEGRKSLNTIHPDDLEDALIIFERTFQDGEGFGETRIKCKEGTFKWIQSKGKIYEDNGQKKLILISRDITKSKEATRKLKESESRLKYLVSSNPAIIYTSKISGDFGATFISDNVRDQWGYQPEDFTKNSDFWLNHIHPDDKNQALEKISKLFEKGRIVYDYRFQFKDGSYHWMRDEVKLILDDNGNPIETVGSVIDITDMIKTKQKLRESEEKYKKMINDLDLGFYRGEIKGGLIIHNPSLNKMLGYEPTESLVGMKASQFSLNPERQQIYYENLIEKGYIKDFSMEIQQKNGKKRIVSLNSHLIRDDNGEPIEIEGIVTDITDKYELEQKLRDSEEMYRILFEESPLTIGILDTTGKVLDVNSMHHQLGSYKKEDLVGKNFAELSLIPKQYYSVISNSFKDLIKYGFSEPAEVQLRDKDGKLIWYYLQSSLIKLRDKTLVQVISQNIDERKEAELKLKESEVKYRDLINNLTDIILEIDLKGDVTYVSPQCYDIIGYQPSEIIGKSAFEFIHPEDLSKIAKAMKKGLQTKETVPVVKYKLVHKDGNIIFASAKGKYVNVDGNDKFIVAIRDVTAHHKIEHKLKESEEKYRLITENANDMISVLNENFEIEYYNESAYQKILGYAKSDILGKNALKFIHPHDFERIAKLLKICFKTGKSEGELRVKSKEGEYYWFDVKGKIYIDNKGRKKGIMISRDITEKKKIQQKLKESEEQFRIISEQSFIGITITQDWKLLYVNLQFAEMFGYTVEEIMNWNFSDYFKIVHEEDVEIVKEKAVAKYKGLTDKITNFQFRALKKTGDVIWVEQSSKSFINKGKPADVSYFIDITDKKGAEIKLKESEEKFRSIAKQSLMGIAIFQDDHYKYVNQQFAKMTGYTEAELLNFAPGEYKKLIHPENWEFVKEQAEKKQLGKKDILEHYEFRGIKKNGEINWLEIFSKTVIYEGKTANLISVIDITERKKIEQQLKESENKLKERVTALSCLYGISKLAEKSELSIGEFIQETLEFIPYAWQFQEVMCARIKYNDREFKTANYKETEWLLAANLNVNEKPFKIEIYNLEERHFLKEETELLVEIGSRLKDIIEKKEAEVKLKESEQKYRTLTQNIPGMVYRGYPDWFTEFITKSESICGYSIDEFNSQKINWIEIIHPDDKEEVLRKSLTLEKKPLYLSLVYRIIAKDGSICWVNDRKISRFSEDGMFMGVDGIVFDVTKRKKMEENLKESELKYKEAYNRADFYKDIFTHDINNILSNIKSSIELSSIYLDDSDRLEDVKDLYDIISGQLMKGSNLVSNIRKLSQLEETELITKPIEVYSILHKAIEYIHKSYQRREINIVKIDIDPDILVSANDLLIDVFDNILDNAVKYNDKPSVEIIVRMSKEKKLNQDYIKLEFSDNGMGITDERKKLIFKKGIVKEIDSKGLGIGLTLVKKIVDSYNGEIWVEDRVEGDSTKGSNFIMLLPETK